MSNILYFKYELYRKFIHLSSSTIAFLLYIFGKDSFLPFIVVLSFFLVLMDFLKRHVPFLYKIYNTIFATVTRPNEKNKLSGASWVFIGSVITIFLFEENIAIIALLVMSVSDSMAAIIGLKYGETKIINKSLEGTLAFIISTSIIIVLLSPATFIIKLSAIIFSTIVELISSPKFNDNLTIPIVTAFILSINNIL